MQKFFANIFFLLQTCTLQHALYYNLETQNISGNLRDNDATSKLDTYVKIKTSFRSEK